MRRAARSILRSIRAVSLSLALGGCVFGDTVAPPGGDPGGGTNNPPSGPEILVVYPDGSIGWTSPPPDPETASSAATLEPLPATRKLVASVEIDGTLGGRMQCGRFRLAVPPGAFPGKGTVSMSMPDSMVMVVDVEITPAELNDFQVPIPLALSTTGADVASDMISIYWYDPENKTWVEMGCDKDLSDNPEVQDAVLPTETRGLLTNLTHFSRYSGGKAGW